MEVRIAVVGGTGFIGQRHCQHVAENKSCQLAAIVDPNPAAAEVAAKYGAPLYSSVADFLVSGNKVDGAIVCTPNHTHVPLAKQLIEAKIPVLCEKPISADSKSARSLIEAAQDHQVRLLIGHHRRFNRFVVAAKKTINSGVLGDITAVSGLWTAAKPPEYFAGEAFKWRSDSVSGGPILINLIHEIDLLQHLLGPVVKVHAERSISRRNLDSAEEGAAIILRFKSGVVGTFVICDNVASPHNFEQGTGENPAMPRSGLDVYRIFGTKATLSAPDMVLSSYGNTAASWLEIMTIQKVEVENVDVPPLESQLKHFVAVCRNEEEPKCSGEDGLQALLVCEAVRGALNGADGGGSAVVATQAD